MRRIIAITLCFFMLLPLIGCAEEELPEVPVQFYYRRAQISCEQKDGLITAEQRESLGHEEDIRYLLSEYLSGPLSPELHRTFPEELVIISMHISDGMANIVFSHHLASLSGIDLSIACACITLTVIELTGVETVQLSAAGTLLGDYQYITMDKECLHLLDLAAIPK